MKRGPQGQEGRNGSSEEGIVRNGSGESQARKRGTEGGAIGGRKKKREGTKGVKDGKRGE